jgi:hypothetical protein
VHLKPVFSDDRPFLKTEFEPWAQGKPVTAEDIDKVEKWAIAERNS